MNASRGPGLLFVIAVLCAEMTSAIELTMVYTALPTLAREFGNSPLLGWVATASLLTSAIASALCGRLGDLYGRRKVLLTVLVFAFSGSVVSALSGNLAGVIAGTALQGVAGALLPLCVALVRERSAPEKTPFYVGLVLGSAGFAAALGLVAGGILTDTFGWPSIFLFSAASALVAFLMVVLFVEPSTAPPRADAKKINYFVGILYAPGIAGLLVVITNGTAWGWSNVSTVSVGLLSISLLVFWIWHQLRAEHPLINLRLLAHHRVSLVYLSTILFAFGPAQHTMLMSRFLQQPAETLVGMGLTASAAGLAMMPVRFIGITAAPIGGHLSSVIGPRLVLIFGSSIVFLGWFIIMAGHFDLKYVMIGMILEGWGFQLMYVGYPNALIKAVSEDVTGEVTGVSQVVKMIALACGTQLIMLTLSDAFATGPLPEIGPHYPSPEQYRVVFVYILVMAALSGLAAALLPQDKKARTPQMDRAASSSESP